MVAKKILPELSEAGFWIAACTARQEFRFPFAGDALLNELMAAWIANLHRVPLALLANRSYPFHFLPGHHVDDPRFIFHVISLVLK